MKEKALVIVLLGVVLATCSSLYSEAEADTTFVSGTIHFNTTWTPAGNPYMVIGGTRIDTNIVLTINPGVVVKINPNLSITVDGALDARGTVADSIIFTAKEGDWSSLNFTGSSIDSLCFLEYCQITWSSFGISFDNASPVVRYCYIANNGGVGYEAS
jgi:hypothetical protein